MDNYETDIAEMLIALTADIVSAYVSNNDVRVPDVPGLIAIVHQALSDLRSPVQPAEVLPEPAVSVQASIKRDHLVCLEDGKRMKMLKRHLMTQHGMTPEEYRARWSLASDYPMVAAEYAETRRNIAVHIGLGRNPDQRRGRRK